MKSMLGVKKSKSRRSKLLLSKEQMLINPDKPLKD